MKRERIDTLGEGATRVAVLWEEERRRFIVEWFRNHKARRRIFSVAKHRTKPRARREAMAYADEVHKARTEIVSDRPATTEALFSAFVNAMEGGWRPATRVSTVARWRLWETHIKPSTDPDGVTAEDLDRFHKALRTRERKMSPNQVRQVFALIRSVYRKALQRRWVTTSDPIGYFPRISKDEIVRDRHEPAEYHPDEWRKLLAVVRDDHPSWWRLRVVLMLEGSQGQRIQAIRHLRWSDIGETILWPAIYQKQGRPLEQPITSAARQALALAKAWRERDGYQGPWVLYSPGRGNVVPADAQPTSYQTLHSALLKAEKMAGVEHMAYRGSHGLRRMAAENVYGATRDMLEAAAWIGDRDVKQLKAYLKRTNERMQNAATAADAATASVPGFVPAEEECVESGVDRGLEESHWSELNRRPQQYEGEAFRQEPSKDAGSVGFSDAEVTRNAPKSNHPIVPGTVPDSGQALSCPPGADHSHKGEN